MKPLQKAGLIAAIAVLVGINFMPTTEVLTVSARNMLGILIA